MLKAHYRHHRLEFKRPGGTSRGVLRHKDTWYLLLEDGDRSGIGECGMFRGLSHDDRPDFEQRLQWVCDHIHLGLEALWTQLAAYPAIRTGLEMAFRSLRSGDNFILYPSQFTEGKSSIPINGLIWMGEKGFMQQQIREKIEAGFSCLKLKIGALDFDTELQLLAAIRKDFGPDEIEIRVDANGAFDPAHALEKLKKLAGLSLHSIEQPIRAGQWEQMALLCDRSPLPIALDEELIGISAPDRMAQLLREVKPQYIILKPTLAGGFKQCDHWIDLAATHRCGWWITSALESNIGLNAIAQFTFTKNSKLPQGLGTGGLFTNNIGAPLLVQNGNLHYSKQGTWDLSAIKKSKNK